MRIRIKINNGSVTHAADYNQETNEIKLYCDSLKYKNYVADVRDYQCPTIENITCKKCLKTML